MTAQVPKDVADRFEAAVVSWRWGLGVAHSEKLGQNLWYFLYRSGCQIKWKYNIFALIQSYTSTLWQNKHQEAGTKSDEPLDDKHKSGMEPVTERARDLKDVAEAKGSGDDTRAPEAGFPADK